MESGFRMEVRLAFFPEYLDMSENLYRRSVNMPWSILG